MSCLCTGGCAGTTSYKVFDPATVKYSGEITLCTVCESKISSEPTLREKQLAAGALRWQTGAPVKPIEPDFDLATAIAAALPADFPKLDEMNGGPIVESELSGMFSRDGGSGIEAS